LVSIVIPSFNNLEKLKNCILSIKNQSFKSYEVWIVDNESTDGTVEYLKTLEAPFYWKSELDNGIYDAMNKGILLATKEWIYFMGADDLLYDDTVLVDVFAESIPDQFKLIIGSIKYDLKENDIINTHTRDGLVKTSWSKKLWIKNSAHHQAIFYNKEIFKERKYSLKYKILADYALNLELYRSNKIKVILIDTIIAICGTEGLSKNYTKNMYKEEVNLKVEQSFILLKPVFTVLAMFKHLIKLK